MKTVITRFTTFRKAESGIFKKLHVLYSLEVELL